MSTTQWIAVYLTGLGTFLALDLLWLGVIARGYYRTQMGSLLADKPNWPVALLFYAIFIAGVLYFAVHPSLGVSWSVAARNGALFGFFTYATYDLTSLAVLRGYPAQLTFVDIAWGTILTASVATAAWRAGIAFGS